VYEELLKQVSAIGVIGLSFWSGILYQKVAGLRKDLLHFQESCDKRHEKDDEIIASLAQLATKVEMLIQNYGELRSAVDRAITPKAQKFSH